MKILRAEIGVAILMGVATYVGFLMLTFVGWLLWLAGSFRFTMRGIPSPFALSSFVGMALYISDRKGFLIRRSGNELIAALLAILGFVLMAESISEGLFTLFWMRWGGTPSWDKRMIDAFTFAFDILVFLSGLLLLTEPNKMLEDKRLYPPSAQRLDVEAQTKYPRDLFARYAEQYPHNPEGVLEWHIHKRMKEGKTREQAIKELTHAY